MAPTCAGDPIPSSCGPLGGQSSGALEVDASQDGFGKWSSGMPPFWGLSTATRCQPFAQSIDGSAHTTTPQLRSGRRLPPSSVPTPIPCQSSLPSRRPSGAPRSLPRMLLRKAMASAHPAGIGARLHESADSRSVLDSVEEPDTVPEILSSRLQVSSSAMTGSGQQPRKVWMRRSRPMSPLDDIRRRASGSPMTSFQRFLMRSLMSGSGRLLWLSLGADPASLFLSTRPVRCYAGLNVLYPRKRNVMCGV